MLGQTFELQLGEKIAPLSKALLDKLAHSGEALFVRCGLVSGCGAAFVDVHTGQSIDPAAGIDGPERPCQGGKVGRHCVDDVQCRKTQLVRMGREQRLGALEYLPNIIGVADAAQPLDGIDDQDDLAIRTDALASDILHSFECEVARLLYELLGRGSFVEVVP
jgi:hypothetical protein